MQDTATIRNHSYTKKAKEVFKENPLLLLSAAATIIILLVSAIGPFIMLHDPIAINLENKVMAPSLLYPFGTDSLGRCVFSRVIQGAKTSLSTAFIIVSISGSLGLFLGLIAGYFGGILDSIIMRTVDVMLAFPGIILALALIVSMGPGLGSVIIALTFVNWTSYARLVRSEVLSIKESEFIEAAKAMGNSPVTILFKYILPNVLTPIIVMATLDVAHVMLSAASLSFLGLGAQPPNAEWGLMINEGREFIRTSPHVTLFPGLAIMITILAFNLLGDSLRDALDPRLREGQME